MDNFVVSARKYRPATFDMVVGQASITNTLKNAIKNNHLAQAFLFCGPRGVGKTTCARIMAKTINCENLTANIEACNQCKSCVSFNESNSFNVHELDAASNNSVDDIRSLVDQVRIPPHIGKYKVYVIDEVHMLSASAFNAFLKTLEEPPAYAKFILATTEKHKIIPTILSRCQIFDFNRITIQDIARQLEFVAQNENVATEPDALHVIAQKADGAMRDALSIFDQIVSFAGNNVTYKAVAENLNVLDYDYFFEMTDHLMAIDTTQVLLLYNTIIDKGFDGAHFISGFASHLRNLLVCKDARTLKLIETGENVKQRYMEQAQKCPSGYLLKALDICNRADISYRNSNNKRLHIELTLLQVAALSGIQESVVQPTVVAPAASQSKPVASATAPAPPVASPPPAPAVKTAAPPATVAPVPGMKIEKPLSIKGNKPSVEEEKKKYDRVDSEDFTEDNNTGQLKENDLLEIWEKLKENYRESALTIFTALNKRPPEITGEASFTITVDNVIQKDALLEKKPEILSFIRKNLKNYAVGFEVKVTDVVQIQKAYLPADKFQRMVEKNAEIERLKNDLDLDLIY